LSQSRGTALAIVGSLIVVLALVPGRTRRVYAALVVAAGVAAAGSDLLHVYDAAAGGSVPTGAAHAAGKAILLAALAVRVVWALLTLSSQRVAAAPRARAASRLASWALAIPVVVVLALAAGSSGRIEHDVSVQWRAFVHLAEPADSRSPASATANSRLLTGAGNRYDYWRIAWDAWKRHPVLGLGAGNYARTYYEHRATIEAVDQPHSLERSEE